MFQRHGQGQYVYIFQGIDRAQRCSYFVDPRRHMQKQQEYWQANKSRIILRSIGFIMPTKYKETFYNVIWCIL